MEIPILLCILENFSSFISNFSLQNVPKRCVVLLVGTMSSGEAVREVSVQAMEEFSAAQEVQYFECDLDHVNQSGVNEIFTSLVDTIVDNILVGGQNFESESL